MHAHRFSTRRSQPGSLLALDFGLQVRVEAHLDQRTIFSAAENLSAQELVSELAELVSRLRVHSFTLRAQLEHVTCALQVNVQCGFSPLARRAALDLAGLLGYVARRHFADEDLCLRGANCADRIAELLASEVR